MIPLLPLVGLLRSNAVWVIGAVVLVGGVWAGHQIDVHNKSKRADAAGYLRGTTEVQGKWNAEKVASQAAALKKQTENQAETDRRLAAQQENDRVKDQHLAEMRDGLVARDAAIARLQHRAAELAAAARGGGPAFDPTSVEQCKAAGEAVDLFADMQRRVVEAAGQLAEYADAARIAGLKCASDYDALTPNPTGE